MQYDGKSVERQIVEISSKHCLPILRIVRDDSGITHGELATKMDLIPSGLSAVVKKMEKCSVPLLTIIQNGKYRKYYLPEYVEKYFAEKEEEKNAEFVRGLKEENLFVLLQHFVDLVGDDWRDTMNLLLQSEEVDESSEVGKIFLNIVNMWKKKEEAKDEEIQAVRNFIRNEVLLYLIDKYIEANS
ncbi:MAG: winged helix-turn-helix domain-containing protein [Merdimonas faecis]|uniref:winged helix-turn-helix domain-containing protein n=1 Tax=Merdimonas faecis TaxID=1653435 RepID=UPI0039903EA3